MMIVAINIQAIIKMIKMIEAFLQAPLKMRKLTVYCPK